MFVHIGPGFNGPWKSRRSATLHRVAQRILGVLGGEDMGIELVRAWCASAQVIYAADSGADRVLATGYQPILVGDLDSFQSGYAMVDLRVEERPDQEYTDCDKLLQLVREDGHDSVTLCSVEGDLLDHLLAGLSSGRLRIEREIRPSARNRCSCPFRSRGISSYNRGQARVFDTTHDLPLRFAGRGSMALARRSA